MTTHVKFGANRAAPIDAGSVARLTLCDVPRAKPLVDPRQTTREALASPLNFPPLAQSVFAGDKIAIALAPGVGAAADVVVGLVESLVAANISPPDITILQTEADVAADPTGLSSALAARDLAAVVLVTHDPADRSRLAYLAATKAGEPIYLNRLLDEADLVIPICPLRAERRTDLGSAGWGIFPWFSDAASSGSYRLPANLESSETRRRLRREADEVHWQIGAPLVIGVAPSAEGGAIAILAGDGDTVAKQGAEIAKAAWGAPLAERVSLVVAGISGPRREQTWEHVAHALAASLSALEGDGAILLCTELSTPPGPAMQKIAGADDPRAVRERMLEEKIPESDAWPAFLLLKALERCAVYLMSELDPTIVESLGMTPVASDAEMNRIIAGRPSCLATSGAQYVAFTPREEPVHE